MKIEQAEVKDSVDDGAVRVTLLPNPSLHFNIRPLQCFLSVVRHRY